jgi:hypothetical protein
MTMRPQAKFRPAVQKQYKNFAKMIGFDASVWIIRR